MKTQAITKTQQQLLIAHKHKLNLTQAITILLLEGESMTTSHISRKIGLTRAAMTGIIDKLESMRLAFRKRNQFDRRVITIGLTDRGREVAHDIAKSSRIISH